MEAHEYDHGTRKLIGKWESRFKKSQPIHVEVGSGKVNLLLVWQKHPEINYIGIDLQDSVLAMAVQKAVEGELDNVQLI